MKKCILLGNKFSLLIQFILLLLALLTLYIKYRFEKKSREGREFSIWVLDVSKQITGMGYAHFLNLCIAYTITLINNSEECVWYFINYTFDSIITIFISFILYKKIINPYVLKNKNKVKKLLCFKIPISKCISGVYYNNIHTVNTNKSIFKSWMYQTLIWISVITFIKFFIFLVFLSFSNNKIDIISPCGKFILNKIFHVYQNSNLELIFVMIIWPGVINIFQYYIQDNILKNKIVVERQLMLNSMEYNEL